MSEPNGTRGIDAEVEARIARVVEDADERAGEASNWVARLRDYLEAAEAEAERRKATLSDRRRRRDDVLLRARVLRTGGRPDEAAELERAFAVEFEFLAAADARTTELGAPEAGPALAPVDADGTVLSEFPDPFLGLPAPPTPFLARDRSE